MTSLFLASIITSCGDRVELSAASSGPFLTEKPFSIQALGKYTDEEVAKGIRLYSKPNFKVAKVYLPSAKIGPIVKQSSIIYDAKQKRNRYAFKREGIQSFYNYARDNYQAAPTITVNAPFFSFNEPNEKYSYLSNYFATKGTEYESGGKSGCGFMVNNDSGSAIIDRLELPAYSQAHKTYQHVIAGGSCLILNGQTVQDSKYDANPNSAFVGRTAFGMKGSTEVYLLVTTGATKATVISELQQFGVDKAMMFDGSGSSQMMKKNTVVMSGDGRTLPLVYAAYTK